MNAKKLSQDKVKTAVKSCHKGENDKHIQIVKINDKSWKKT